MTNDADTSYRISQGYEVLQPKPGKAYPILCEEWKFLKDRINELSYKLNIYMEIGFVLIGITLSTFATILTGAFSQTTPQIPSQGTVNTLTIAWAVIAVTLIAGVLCIVFAFEKEKIKKTHASEITSQMEIIEKRYQSSD